MVDAQASGCPVVAFDIGGVREYLFNQQCGILVPPNSVQDLQNAIYELLTNRELAFKYSQNCATVARSRTWQIVALEVEQLLIALFAKKPAPVRVQNFIFNSHLIKLLKFDQLTIDEILETQQIVAEGKIISLGQIKQLIDSNPEFYPLYHWQGLILQHQEKLQLAIDSFKNSLKYCQKPNWQLDFNLTMACAEAKQLKEAGFYAKRILDLNPNFPLKDLLLELISLT